jgi:6-phosphogluconate dehydrogenase
MLSRYVHRKRKGGDSGFGFNLARAAAQTRLLKMTYSTLAKLFFMSCVVDMFFHRRIKKMKERAARKVNLSLWDHLLIGRKLHASPEIIDSTMMRSISSNGIPQSHELIIVNISW